MSTTTIVDFYSCTDTNDPVKINVVIGYAQRSDTSLKLNGISIGNGNYAGSFSETLGSNKDLKNKTLSLSCTVLDIQPDTNQTSVTITITGGVDTFTASMDKTVNTNDVAFYTATIYMI